MVDSIAFTKKTAYLQCEFAKIKRTRFVNHFHYLFVFFNINPRNINKF